MSQEQSFLTPEQQAKLFDQLKTAGVLSQDAGQPTTTPDTQAQGGIGNVDFSTLQAMLKHASNPDAVPMQEGDKLHPMDAISQIVGGMAPMQGPQSASGIEHTGGPQITNDGGQLQVKTRMSGSPIQNVLGMLGVKQKTDINSPNYYPALKAQGLDKYLPSGLASMPDGTPFVGKETDTQARASALLDIRKTGQGSEMYGKDELIAQGIPEDMANALTVSALKAGKAGVSSKEVSNFLGSERIGTQKMMAEARATMAGVAKLGQALKVGGFDAAQPMAEQANKNLLVVEKAQPLIDQIIAQGGTANVRQQAELAGNLAMLTANNSGVLTDQRMNEFLPQSIVKKYGGWKEYFTNAQAPIDFTGFLPQMQDLLTREKQANQGVSSAASQLGINIMSATGQPGQAGVIAGARNKAPIVGSGTPSPVVQNPINTIAPNVPAPVKSDALVTDYIVKNKIRDTPANRKWARGKLGF